MKLSVEISLYPLQEQYLEIIEKFLEDINRDAPQIDIRTSNMSTRIFGDYNCVTELINDAMRRSMEKYGKVVFVCKYLQGDARELRNYS